MSRGARIALTVALLCPLPAAAGWIERFPLLLTTPGATRKIALLADGGFLVTAPLHAGSVDAYLVRLDEVGRPRWARSYAGQSLPTVVAEATSGALLNGGWAAGRSWLLVTDAQGVPLSGLQTSEFERLLDVVAAPDGGFLLLFSNPNKLVKIDVAGAVSWVRRYPSTTSSNAFLTRARSDGYLLAYPRAGAGSALVRLDASGDVLWAVEIDIFVTDAAAMTDGGFALSGEVPSVFLNDFWMMRLDAAGAALWQRAWNAGGAETGARLVAASGGDIFGACYLFDTSLFHHLLARFDPTNGSLLARRMYDLETEMGQVEPVEALVATADGGCAFGVIDGGGLALLRADADATVGGGCPLESAVNLSAVAASLPVRAVTVSWSPDSVLPFTAWTPVVSPESPLRAIECGASCVSSSSPVGGVRAVKQLLDVGLSWSADSSALGYNGWYVTDKRIIDSARQATSPPAVPIGGCVPSSPPPPPAPRLACVDAGAVPRGSPARFFYQIRVACGATSEGP